MTGYLVAALHVLRADLYAVSSRAAAFRRRLRTRAVTRRRTRRWLVVAAVAVLGLFGAGAAMAAGGSGTGTGNPFLDAFAVKDTHGYSSANYELSLGGGGGFGIGSMINGTAGFFLTIGWDFYRLLVSIVLWFYDFALQFKVLDIMAGPAGVIAGTLNHTIARLGLVPLLLIFAFIVCIFWIHNGKAAAGIAEIMISLLIASLLGSTLANPVGIISGPNGVVHTAKDLGVGLSAQIVSGGSNTSSDPATLQRQTSAALADKFIRIPHELINYGAVIDSDPKCVGVYNTVIAKGPWGDDSHPRDVMGDCNPAYKKAAENPTQGLLGLATLSFGGFWLLLLVLALVLVLSLLVGSALFEAVKFGLAMLKGIVPGAARQDLFTGVAVMGICFLAIIGTIAGIGAFTVSLDGVFASTRSYNPIQVFMVVDLFIVLFVVVLIRSWLSARKAGRKLGERMQKSLSPGPTAVSTNRGPSAVQSIAGKAGSYMATKRALARSPLGQAAGGSAGAGLTGAATAAAGVPAGPGGSPGAVRRSGALVAKGAWKAAKVGIASTVGAPVYAPRAVGVVKKAATARKAAMTTKFAAARTASTTYVSGKTQQATAFGQEYVHNVGAAAKAVSKYSGAAHVAKAALAMGADPLTAGAAAGVTYFATSRRPTSASKAPASQLRPRHVPDTTPDTARPPARRPDPAAVPAARDLHGSHSVGQQEADRAAFLAGMRQRAASRAAHQQRTPSPAPAPLVLPKAGH